jgi:hypothetical protein
MVLHTSVLLLFPLQGMTSYDQLSNFCTILVTQPNWVGYKLQPIRSLGSWSRDKEYEALTKCSNLGSCQGSGGSSFATRVGGTTHLVGWTILGSRKARLEGMVVNLLMIKLSQSFCVALILVFARTTCSRTLTLHGINTARTWGQEKIAHQVTK